MPAPKKAPIDKSQKVDQPTEPQIPKRFVTALYIYLIILLMSIVTIMLLVFALVDRVYAPGAKNGDIDTSKEEVEKPTADYSVLQKLNSQGVLDFLAKGNTGFLYIGRPTCPHCQAFAPILSKVVKEKRLTVYYYDTDAAKSEPEKKNEVLEATNVIGVPSFLFIKDGVIVETLGAKSEESLLEFINLHQ